MAETIDQAFEEAFTELNIADILDEGTDEQEPEQEEPTEADESTEDTEEPEDTGDEADAEDDEADEDGEDEQSDPAVIEIKEGTKLRLPDGTEVDADKAVLFQQAFTRKTTELADQRKEFEQERDTFVDVQKQVEDTYEQMRTWYEERTQNPSDWVQEVALESGDATRTIAKAIWDLGTAGKLDPKFMEAFGIEEGPVAELAANASKDAEIEELKQWRQQQEAERQATVHRDTLVAQYQGQWDDIKLTHGLELSGPKETEAKRELMQFAVAKHLTGNLSDAYILMQATRQAQQSDPVTVPPKPAPDPKQTRALKAVNPRSTGSGAARSATKTAPKDSRSAALEALAEMGLT